MFLAIPLLTKIRILVENINALITSKKSKIASPTVKLNVYAEMHWYVKTNYEIASLVHWYMPT